MDEVVLRAIRKWPNVPSVYGWLSLDRRGNWSIKGERIANPAIAGFIGRNYARDEKGRWYFQNGPQRVFVTLAYTPYLYRTQANPAGGLSLTAHTGTPPRDLRGVFLDDSGAFLLDAEPGVGVINDQDLPELIRYLISLDGEVLNDAGIERLLILKPLAMPAAVARLRVGTHVLPVSLIRSTDVPVRFGFDPDPHPAPGEPEC
jgi:hypothetical protein